MYEIKKVTLAGKALAYKLDLGSLGEGNNDLFLCKLCKGDGTESFWLMTAKMITGITLEIASQRWNFGTKNVVHHNIGSGVHLSQNQMELLSRAYDWSVTTAEVLDGVVWRENGEFNCRGTQQIKMRTALERLMHSPAP